MKNTMAMKLICMLLCVVMLGAMLAGCASGKQETAQTQPAAADPAATSTPAAETDAPATEESPLTGTISIMSTKDSWYPGFDDVCEQIEKNYGIAVDLTLVDDSSMQISFIAMVFFMFLFSCSCFFSTGSCLLALL